MRVDPGALALARDLRQAGASAALVRAARRAAREEARHTRLCTALASRHAGATIDAIVPDVPAAADVDHAALLERPARPATPRWPAGARGGRRRDRW